MLGSLAILAMAGRVRRPRVHRCSTSRFIVDPTWMTNHGHGSQRPASGSPGRALVWSAALLVGVATLVVVLLLTHRQSDVHGVAPSRASSPRVDRAAAELAPSLPP